MTRKIHLAQMDKLTDGYRSWCGRLFANPDDPHLSPDYEAVTCFVCSWAFDAFLNKYPKGP